MDTPRRRSHDDCTAFAAAAAQSFLRSHETAASTSPVAVASPVAGVHVVLLVDDDAQRYVAKASARLPPHATLAGVLATTHKHRSIRAWLGDLVLDDDDADDVNDPLPSSTSPETHHEDKVRWMSLAASTTHANQDTDATRAYTFIQHTNMRSDTLVSVWHSVDETSPRRRRRRATHAFHRCGLVVKADTSRRGSRADKAATTPLVASFYWGDECTIEPSSRDDEFASLAAATCVASFVQRVADALKTTPSTTPSSRPPRCAHCSQPNDAHVACAQCGVATCVDSTPLRAPVQRRLCRSCFLDGSSSRHSSASSSVVSRRSRSSSPTPPPPTRHTLALASIPSQLYGHVLKTFHVDAGGALEAEMREMGRDTMDVLLDAVAVPIPSAAATSPAGDPVRLFHVSTPGLLTIKAVVSLPDYNLLDVLALLDMRTTADFRDTMRFLLDGTFVDGAVLHAAPPSTVSSSAESMTLNWLAVQNAKVHLPSRDYVFLKYGDVVSRRTRAAVAVADDAIQSTETDVVAVSVWESVDLPHCGPLPHTLNIMRLAFHRCGYVAERVLHPTTRRHHLNVSFFISDTHDENGGGLSTASQRCLLRMAQSVTRLGDALVRRFVLEHRHRRGLDAATIHDAPKCHVCTKRFSLLRRKRQCVACANVMCKACTDGPTQAKDFRACVRCAAPHNMSLHKYWAPSIGGNVGIGDPVVVVALTASAASSFASY
ncbi:Aste57867_22193 [Aphanomyces stellatus]|uniref:Aste57867_22193 protein n=1 Tax=Aphanomyces stellatus TaxID=120398 RepID=A0A485LKV1_9STRA|nr:hypothetical protein As57867_022124 [Aphanomyces stellatus]VFT98860.1 Aste57867_22193 [Aphanomyces stellatus]